MEITYQNDINLSLQKCQGSDGRLNVSSRSDSRAYYVSRNSGLAFSVAWEHADSESGEFVAYWKNTSPTRNLVIQSVGLNSVLAARFKLHFVTGTAAGGTTMNPVNLNRSSSKDAEAIAMEGGSAATGITGLTADGLIDLAACQANGHEEFRIRDQLILGQNDAVAVQCAEVASPSDGFGVIFGFYE